VKDDVPVPAPFTKDVGSEESLGVRIFTAQASETATGTFQSIGRVRWRS
jgi:hypothetical protein